jgi:hypothetical protein
MSHEEAAPSRDEMVTRLSRLARGMTNHAQTLFLVEQLQPSWLVRRRSILVYGLVTRLLDAAVAALGFLLVVCPVMLALDLGNENFGRQFLIYLRNLLSPALLGASAAALALWTIDLRRLDRRPATHVWQPAAGRSRLRRVLSITFDSAIAFLLGLGLVALFFEMHPDPRFSLFARDLDFQYWHTAFFFAGPTLIVGLLRRTADRLTPRDGLSDISLVETLIWSWKGFLKGVLFGILVAAAFFVLSVLVAGTVATLTTNKNFPMLLGIAGVVSSIAFGLLAMLRKAFRVGLLDIKARPNEGMRRSFANSVLVARKTFLAVVVAYLAVFGYFHTRSASDEKVTHWLVATLGSALMLGVGLALIAGHWYGGADVLRHTVLRLLLAREKTLPLRLVAFLEEATELGFVQRVGAGFMFMHRYLLEYFAGLATQAGAGDSGLAEQGSSAAAASTAVASESQPAALS